MRLPERAFGTITAAGVLITAVSTALTAVDGVAMWVVALLGGASLGMLAVLAGLRIAGGFHALSKPGAANLVDPITKLASAEQLALDITRALRDQTASVLVLHLLDGFKRYSEAYGRACGDTMLSWLGAKLREATAGEAAVYRMRGGEFALLAPGSVEDTAELRARAAEALGESGEGFVICSHAGEVVLPGQARTVSEALKLADHRAQSRRGAAPCEGHAKPPEDPIEATRISASRFDVAKLATEIGRRMSLPADRLDDLAAAAHLRDIGNMALPSAILNTGRALGDAEWRFVRLHTLVGERLLSANFAMGEVGRLVRSSHERWDGNGYPDGLAGEDIPLGSRILFVCSAFEDMTSTRAHRPALGIEAALGQLSEGAAGQFDPDVVRVFAELFPQAQGEPRALSAYASPRRLRVLVADDDAASRFLLWRAIEAAGHECMTVTSGHEALRTFRRQLPDIVICDARLPEIDGRELCRLIRSEPHAPRTYFVMLTALGDLALVKGGTADDFLTKPIARDELDLRLLAAAHAVMGEGGTVAAL